ncbi:hypothetical protein D3C77_377220 [compost metagenome]
MIDRFPRQAIIQKNMIQFLDFSYVCRVSLQPDLNGMTASARDQLSPEYTFAVQQLLDHRIGAF